MNDFVKMQQLYLESVPVASNPGSLPNDYIPLKYNQDPPGSGMDINRRTSNSGFKKNQFPLGARGGAPGVGEGEFTYVIDEEIPAVEIINLDVLEKLDKLRDECIVEKGEEDYSVLQLSRLRDCIIALSEGKPC